MINDLRSYRQHALEAYLRPVASDNPDQVRRATFSKPAPEAPAELSTIATQQIGPRSYALSLADFIEQYRPQAEQSIFAHAERRWAHRQIYAYVDAYATRTLVVYIADRLTQPIYLDRLLKSVGNATCDSCMIIVADDAHATIIDRYASSQGTHVRSLVCHVGTRAQLTMVYDHAATDQAVVASAHLFTAQQDSSIAVQCVIGSGTQTDLWFDLFLAGTGAHATVRGIYATAEQNRLSVITEQQHNAPHTTSEMTLNGCLSGNAHATYQGRIHIDQHAQHAAAQQRNHTMLLSDTARATSLPTLEALAHEVHCVHASAVGTLDTNAIAYLMSRGIPFEQARMLMVQGFMQATVGACPTLEPLLQDGVHTLGVHTV